MKFVKGLFAAVVCVAIGVAVGCFVLPKLQTTRVAHGKTTIDITVLEESMEKNNELSTAKYLYTDSIAIADQNTLDKFGFSDIVMPWTDATYILQFDGIVKAGYDLDKASVETKGDDTIVLTLPAPKILSHETDNVRLVYEEQNLMNPLHAGEESNWVSGKKGEMEDRAIELGLYEEAQQNAKVTFQSLFEPAIPEGATLEVVFL
ncbi:MAG: DUF4230 domain-containing protein [Atopobiaceae bacterium]|nr:DUF4230 domain-containing protein [Atopobiaceae bacterium]